MMQLKRAVENIVGSIPAEEVHKNKYRQELYAHVHELYKEERPNHTDEAAALNAALKRLGELESLRAEFLKSLSPLSRWMGRLDFAFTWQPGESIWRHVFRVGGTCAAFYFVAVYGLLIPLVIAFKGERLDMTIGAGLFGIVIGLSLPTFLIAVSVLQVQTRKIMGTASSIPKKCLRMAGVSTLSSLAIWVVTMGSLHILLATSVNFLGEAHAAVALLEHVRTAFVPRWCSVFMVFAMLLPPLSLDRRFNGYIPDWPYAE